MPAADDIPADACPLCGGSGPPSRISLAKRAAPPFDALSTPTAAASDEASSALREALARSRRGLADLQAELELERGAAAGAASEAMSMILRLQRDKSEAMMEARQYRRYAEERFAHDAAECGALHDALERRDSVVRGLSARLRACQARLLSLGFPASPTAAAAERGASVPASLTEEVADERPCPCSDGGESDGGEEEYRCSVQCVGNDVGTPRTHHLLNRMPSPEADKAVVMFGSPRRHSSSRHNARTPSSDDDTIPYGYDCRIALADEFPLFTPDRDAPDDEEAADRVYTVDAVHGVPVMAPEDCCYFGRGEGGGARARPGGWAADEDEMRGLKARLQALEADRESMRHAIMSMGDEKAQVVLLREIAQQLCRDAAAPFPVVPVKQPRPQPVVVAQRKVGKRRSSFAFAKVFIVSVIKWVVSIFCWRKKSTRIRYPIGMCGSNVGLMLVLDRFPKQRQKKIPKRKLSASTLII